MSLYEFFMMDYLCFTLRNLAHLSSNAINHPLRAISSLLAIFFLGCVTLEIIFSFTQANRIYLKDKSTLTPIEKDLKGVYYSGLDKKSLKASWWIRNFNIIFLIRFMLVALLAYTL